MWTPSPRIRTKLTWRSEHYDMTLRRRLFQPWQKKFSYVAIAGAVAAMWTGIEVAGLQAWWKIGVATAVAAFAALFVRLSRQNRRVDT